MSGKVSYKIYDFDKNDFSQKPKSLNLSKQVLIIDGIFLGHPKHSVRSLVDLMVYLDVHMKTGDRRRITREKKRYGEKFLPDDHPENWVRYFKKAYENYLKKHKPDKLADLVIKV